MRKMRLTIEQAKGNPCPVIERDEQFVYVGADTECWKAYSASLIPKPATKKKSLRADCVHRGKEIDKQQCKTCSGVVMLKIFSCEKHGRCVIGKAPDGVRSCSGCRDYAPMRITEHGTRI